MNELVQIAQNVTNAVSSSIPFSISLSNENGYIIGATDSKRIGIFHPDFKKVVNNGEFVIFSKKDVMGMNHVLPGIAVPLVFDQKTIGVLGIIGSPDSVKPYADLIKQYVELMWQEFYYKQIEDLESRIEETYLQYILLNETSNEARITEYSKILGIDIDAKLFCIVIDMKDYLVKEKNDQYLSLTINNFKQMVLQEIQKYFTGPEIKKINFLNTDKVIMIVSVSSLDDYFSFMSLFKEKSKKLVKRLKNMGIQQIHIAAGRITKSIYNLNFSYQEALYLLEHESLQKTRQSIWSLHDWEVLTELLPLKMDAKFIERVKFELKQLTTDNQFNELKHSFLAYCEHSMNVTKASASLYIHRNTLIYRLRKIEHLTSIDTKSFQQCSLLYYTLNSKFS